MVDCLVDPTVYLSIIVVGIDNEGKSNANSVQGTVCVSYTVPLC